MGFWAEKKQVENYVARWILEVEERSLLTNGISCLQQIKTTVMHLRWFGILQSERKTSWCQYVVLALFMVKALLGEKEGQKECGMETKMHANISNAP